MTDENKKPAPNKEGEILIKEVQKALAGLSGVGGSISDAEKSTLENLNALTSKAQVIVNKDRLGATVISSTGNITEVGNTKIDIHDPNTENNMQYMYEQVAKALQSKGLVDNTEIHELKKLDSILKDVAIVISDDKKSVTICDDRGHYQGIDIAEVQRVKNKGLSR